MTPWLEGVIASPQQPCELGHGYLELRREVRDNQSVLRVAEAPSECRILVAMKRGTESGPEVVAQSYLAALASRDWDAAADLVDEGMVGRAIAPFRGVAGNEGGNASSGRRDHLESDISNLFRGVASRAELETMSPSEAFARLLAGFGARTYEAARPRQPVRIVGSVVKGGVAHVVYYSKWESEDDSASLPRVLVLRQSLNGWAVLPTAEALAGC